MITLRALVSRAAPLLAVIGLLGVWQIAALIINTDSFPTALDAHTRTRLQNDLLNIWERDRKTVLFVTHSVDEAVFLSDKVVVMTRAPGRIKQIVDIDLPRPRRRAELLLDGHYQKYIVDIERLIDDTGEEGLQP